MAQEPELGSFSTKTLPWFCTVKCPEGTGAGFGPAPTAGVRLAATTQSRSQCGLCSLGQRGQCRAKGASLAHFSQLARQLPERAGFYAKAFQATWEKVSVLHRGSVTLDIKERRRQSPAADSWYKASLNWLSQHTPGRNPLCGRDIQWG